MQHGIRKASVFMHNTTKKLTGMKTLQLNEKRGTHGIVKLTSDLESSDSSRMIVPQSESTIAAETQNFFEQNPESKHLRDVLEDLRLETGEEESNDDR